MAIVEADSYMKVKIGGAAMSPGMARHITSISFKESLDKLDEGSVSVSIPEDSKFIKEFDLYGEALVIELVRKGSVIRSFSGDIMQIAWARGGGADRTVTLTAVDRLHRLKRGREDAKVDDRRWSGKKLDEIVKDVAKAWGMNTKGVTGSDKTPDNFEWDQDDATLLVHLATEYHYTVRLDTTASTDVKGDLVFEKDPGYKKDAIQLKYGLQISSINATHSLDGLLKQVTATGQKTEDDAEPVKHVAKKDVVDGAKLNPVTGVSYIASLPGFTEKISDESGHKNNMSTVKGRAEGKILEAADSFVSGNFDCRFLPELACGQKVTVSGAGWPLDGTFVASSVNHSMDASGYRTQVEFSSNSIAKKPS